MEARRVGSSLGGKLCGVRGYREGGSELLEALSGPGLAILAAGPSYAAGGPRRLLSCHELPSCLR